MNHPLIRRFQRLSQKYGFPFKLAVFCAIILICLAVLILKYSQGTTLNTQTLFSIGVVIVMSCVGLWASIQERKFVDQQQRSKKQKLPKAKKS